MQHMGRRRGCAFRRALEPGDELSTYCQAGLLIAGDHPMVR